MPSSCHLAPESDDFLIMVDRGLCISDNGIPSPPACQPFHARSASSAYPSQSNNTSRIQSPVSEHCRGNRLSFSGLSRYGRTNDCLSNLQSDTPTSGSRNPGDTSNHDLVADTAAAITEWHGATAPKKSARAHNFGLADHSDLFPSDSLSQRDDFSLAPSSRPSLPSEPGPTHRSAQTPKHADDLDTQYDGTVDPSRNRSPEPKNGLTTALGAPPLSQRAKRKASVFSLWGLTRSFSKRPKVVAFRQWATNVYRGSSRRISNAYDRLRYQRQTHFSELGPWKGMRRRRPVQPRKGTVAGGDGVFEYEKDPNGNGEWWTHGVGRYHHLWKNAQRKRAEE